MECSDTKITEAEMNSDVLERSAVIDCINNALDTCTQMEKLGLEKAIRLISNMKASS
jgi:hypothetical protein